MLEKYTLDNDKQSVIIYHKFMNHPRLHCFIKYVSFNPEIYKTLRALHTPNSYFEI